MARWGRLIAVAGALIIALFLVFSIGNSLSSHTYSEARGKPNSIIVERDTAFGTADASYTNSDHRLHCYQVKDGKTLRSRICLPLN